MIYWFSNGWMYGVVDKLICLIMDLLFNLLNLWLINILICWFVFIKLVDDCLIDWLFELLIDWLIFDILIDWLIGLIDCSNDFFILLIMVNDLFFDKSILVFEDVIKFMIKWVKWVYNSLLILLYIFILRK